MKKRYEQPALAIVRLQPHGLLANSPLNAVNSNLVDDDELDISSDDATDGFWGR